MIRGTTPTHTFTLPVDVEHVTKVKIIYAQNDIQVFCKETEDCLLEGTDVNVTLTQEETFMFDENSMVQIQLRVLTDSGDSLVSNEILTTVGKCLDDEVLE